MAKRSLYSFNWNHKVYVSTRKRELKRFSEWMGGLVGPPRVIEVGRTNWNIPGIERGPGWVPYPVIEHGVIEYEPQNQKVETIKQS